MLLEVQATDERDYKYTWYRDGLILSGGNEGRILINEGGTYEAMATTTSGTLCSKAISIQLLTSEIAKITQKDLNQQDERITNLLAELNSTLDLYYEKSIDAERGSNDH